VLGRDWGEAINALDEAIAVTVATSVNGIADQVRLLRDPEDFTADHAALCDVICEGLRRLERGSGLLTMLSAAN
jgi:hypothetical protein